MHKNVDIEECVPRLLIRILKIGVTAWVSVLVYDAVSNVVEYMVQDDGWSYLRRQI